MKNYTPLSDSKPFTQANHYKRLFMKHSQIFSTLTHKAHNMTVTKDPRKEQSFRIEKSNEFIDLAANHVIGAVSKAQMVASRPENPDTTSPLIKTFNGVGSTVNSMVIKLKALNQDTTITEDKAMLLQSSIINDTVSKMTETIKVGTMEANKLTSLNENKLFSRGVDESPRALAMLGNDALLKKAQEDYISMADNRISASAVNAFRVYGLLGGKEQSDSIATALDRRHSPDQVHALASLSSQLKGMNNMTGHIKTMKELLHRDPEALVGIRNRVVE